MIDKKLIGKWVIDPEDDQTIDIYGDTSLDFDENGGLTYSIKGQDSDQMIFMTYRIEGDFIFTDQPSKRNEEKTRFELTSNGYLILIYEGEKTKYIRAVD